MVVDRIGHHVAMRQDGPIIYSAMGWYGRRGHCIDESGRVIPVSEVG